MVEGCGRMRPLPRTQRASDSSRWFKCPFHLGSPGSGDPNNELLLAQETSERDRWAQGSPTCRWQSWGSCQGRS